MCAAEREETNHAILSQQQDVQTIQPKTDPLSQPAVEDVCCPGRAPVMPPVRERSIPTRDRPRTELQRYYELSGPEGQAGFSAMGSR